MYHLLSWQNNKRSCHSCPTKKLSRQISGIPNGKFSRKISHNAGAPWPIFYRRHKFTIHIKQKCQKARAQIMATRRRPFEMKTAKRARTAYVFFSSDLHVVRIQKILLTLWTLYCSTCLELPVCLVKKIVSSVPSVPSCFRVTHWPCARTVHTTQIAAIYRAPFAQ